MFNGYLGYLNNSIKFMFLNLKKNRKCPLCLIRKMC